jgi:hypothetical protein
MYIAIHIHIHRAPPTLAQLPYIALRRPDPLYACLPCRQPSGLGSRVANGASLPAYHQWGVRIPIHGQHVCGPAVFDKVGIGGREQSTNTLHTPLPARVATHASVVSGVGIREPPRGYVQRHGTVLRCEIRIRTQSTEHFHCLVMPFLAGPMQRSLVAC